jgi:hypothetical protein
MIGRSMTISPLCVIAQQYSSVTLGSLRFHYRKEKFGWRVKNVINY